mgnify:FL=1
MRNNNKKAVGKLSAGSMKQNKLRNRFAILAICLTTLLFTAVFSMGFSMLQIFQEQTMREVGGRFHAGLKRVTLEQYEKITDNPRVVSSSYNIFLGMADNVKKRQAEIRWANSREEIKNAFVELKEGTYPEKEEDLIADTLVLQELQIPVKLGEKVPLEFTFMGQTVKKEFTLCGWYEGSQISHASELYVSSAYWEEISAGYTEEDFRENYHNTGEAEGLINGNLFFKNSRNIEENITAAIQEAGYIPADGRNIEEEDLDKAVEYGVNWAYMNSRMEGMDLETMVLLAAAFLIILLTGYLIIYNIFQLSILKEIRFYGLLKTIGTTKRQIRSLVYRQVRKLCIAGIPAGLILGYFAGQILVPMALQMSSYEADGKLRFSPWIFLFGAVFSLFTVLISCRKPAKLAGNVSPIEAVKYTEGNLKRKRKKKSRGGAKIRRMALSNLGRNKKKTAVVIFSVSLSVILLELIATAVGSFRIEEYLEDRISGDYMIGNANWTRAVPAEMDFTIDEAYLEGADSLPGITGSGELWKFSSEHRLSEKGLERMQELYQQGKLNTDYRFFPNGEEGVREILNGERPIEADIYGYSEELLRNLEAVRGELDLDQFRTGDYVLLVENSFTDAAQEGDSYYDPGDTMTLEIPTEKTETVLEYDENGQVMDSHLSGLESREFQVMAVVSSLPSSMDIHAYSMNGITIILPLEEIRQVPNAYLFAKSYTVEEQEREAFQDYLKYYTEQVDSSMGYVSKDTLTEEFSGVVQGISAVGFSLCAVVAVIGILNFANSVLTGILSRKQEIAVLQSIGMTRGQVREMLLWESGYYLLISAVISILAGSLGAYVIVGALNQVVLCFAYRYTPLPFLIMLPVFAVLAAGISLAAYSQTQKKSMVERLRED